MNTIRALRRLPFCLCLSLCLIAVAADRAPTAELAGLYGAAPGQTATYIYHAGEYYTELLPLDVTFEFPGGDPTTMLTATFHKPIIGAKADGTPITIGGMIPLTVTGASTNGRDFDGNIDGTQYFFDWTIEPAAGGELIWSGMVAWFGGRVEQTTITGARLVPIPIPEPGVLAMVAAGMWAALLFRRGWTA